MSTSDLKKKSTSSAYEGAEVFKLMETDLQEAEKWALELAKSRQSSSQDQSLRKLLEISNAMNSNLKLERLLAYVMDQVIEMTKAEYGYLIFLKEDGGLEFKVAHNLAKEEIESAEFEISRSVIREVIENQKTVFLQDASQEERFKNKHSILDLQLKSILSVPLKIKQKLLGLIYLENRSIVGMFTPDQAELLEVFANQAATAIENAQLFELTDEKLQKKVNELSAINSVISTISQTMDLKLILNDVLKIIRLITKADYVDIHLKKGNKLFLGASYGLEPSLQEKIRALNLDEPGVKKLIDPSNWFVNKKPSDEKNLMTLLAETLGVQSYLCLPLKSKENFIGLIVLSSKEHNHFTEENIEFLSSIATQIGVGIENVQLYVKETNKARRLRVINQIGLKITSILEIEKVLEEVIRLLYSELNYYAVTIGLIQKDRLIIKSMYEDDKGKYNIHNHNLELKEKSILGWVAKSNRTLLVEDVNSDPRYYHFNGLRETKSELAVPIELQGKVLGVLDAQSNRIAGFDEEDLQLLQSVANQTAVALENARLYANSEKKIKELSVLNDVARVVNSTLDLDQLLKQIYQQLTLVINAPCYYVALYDEKNNQLNFEILIDDKKQYPKTTVPLGDGVVSYVIRTKKPLLINDLETDIKKLPIKVGTIGSNKTSSSWLGVPMLSGEKVLGVLAVCSYEKNAFSEEDLQFFTNITSQAAIAIINAQLFHQVLRGKQEWEQTFDSITDLICLIDPEYRIIRVNRTLAQKLGMEPEQTIGKKCHQVFHNRLDSPCPECAHRQAMVTKKPSTLEMKGTSGDEVFLISAFPRFSSKGEFIGSVYVLRDISEQKRLREQLVQSEKMAAVGQLVSGVAHELNNPLAGVMGYSQLLLMNNGLDSKTQSYLNKISKESDRAKNIVNNLLTFARKHKPEKKYLDINTILDQTIELRAYDLKVGNIQVLKNFEPQLPRTMADFNQLQQVFLNIMNNAHQAIQETKGKGEIRIRTEKAGEMIRIILEDNGPGIPEENLNKIFEPFFTTKEVGRGTGLGLSISYGIIQQHGGKISARSILGQGATFVIELPVLKEEKAAVSEKKEKPKSVIRKIEKKNILAIDDEQSILDILMDTLQQEGHQVDVASNGRTGLSKVKASDYDLIITDIKMPDFDGRRFYEEVKKYNEELAKKIIFTTGDLANPETEAFLDRVKQPCIPKPFNLEEVKQTIIKFFD
ncbi:MAG: GAF domain-containing protein [candidate division Zixibacteria bacterium]|nr:GAF domain-containing protein [candidate division Zixibacteria bacterium]